METPKLVALLQEFFSGDIEYDDQTLQTYSHDTSLYEIVPQVIVFPKNREDIKKLVEFVSLKKKDYPNLSLTARSAGTDMSGGAINNSIIVDFTRYFTDIGEINETGTSVEPGVYYRNFEKKTLRHGLLLPSYPASRQICALGGMVNNNSGGERTLRYGKTIDYVKNIRMVLSDGNEYQFGRISKEKLAEKMQQRDFEGRIYKQMYQLIENNYDLIKSAKPAVSKNSTAYNIWDVWDREYFDLSKIFVGAQGTLGINTRTTVTLVPRLKRYGLLVIYVNDIKVLPHLIQDVLKHSPVSFEAFDDETLKLAIRFMPQFARVLGVVGTFKMGMQFLPNLIRFATKGIPKFTLLVEFDGKSAREIREKVHALKESLGIYVVRLEAVESEAKAKQYFTIRRESFNLLRKNVKDKHTAPFIDDFIVRPEYLVDFFPRLTEILDRNEIHSTLAGHMGDGNFHIIPLMEIEKESEREKIEKVQQEVQDLVLEYKGSISAEHNDGMVRGPFIKQMYGQEMFEIFKEVKNIFDPDNIFNPHKKTDARLSFSQKYIRQKF
ncbi:MAG TPA: FAD-binding oxidoreductase [Candidatus Levybacteria bacterium]|nr:FAD-binding oxidoreductase [Candidatus Levybacteria bacterium]